MFGGRHLRVSSVEQDLSRAQNKTMKLSRLKVMKLFCTECDKPMGEPRPGKGRQKLLCAKCTVDKRRESGRKQDAKRKEERRSQKRK